MWVLQQMEASQTLASSDLEEQWRLHLQPDSEHVAAAVADWRKIKNGSGLDWIQIVQLPRRRRTQTHFVVEKECYERSCCFEAEAHLWWKPMLHWVRFRVLVAELAQ